MKNIINKKNILSAWTFFIFLLIAWPMPVGVETGTGNLDKIVHFVIFGVFAYLVAINIKERFSLVKTLLAAFLASCVYAYLAEIIQLFVPGRDYSLFDWAAGVSGAVGFLIIFYARSRK